MPVLGPIRPEQLGVTLCHEHLYHKSYTRTFVPNPVQCCHSQLNGSLVSTDNLWYTNYHPYTHEDNLDFTSVEVQNAICEEMKFYRQNGGHSVVEVTTFGKSLPALARIAHQSGVNIVGNTGFYIKPAFSDSITTQSEESLYTTMKDEFVSGVEGHRPGVIGE